MLIGQGEIFGEGPWTRLAALTVEYSWMGRE